MEENKTVTLVVNGSPTEVTKEQFSEYTQNPKFMVKKEESEDKEKFILLEKIFG